MKRAFCFVLAFFSCFALLSCAKEKEGAPLPTEPVIGADRLDPLFRIAAYEGQSEPKTRYYPTQNGFCYLSKTEKGYTCGFFALPNLISNEDLFTTRSEPGEIFDLGEDKALVFDQEKVWFLSLDAGSGIGFEKAGKFRFTAEPVFGADKALYYETDRFLLTADLKFSEDYSALDATEYVVMPKEKLEPFGFTRILCVSADGERLYYAYEQDGKTGYAYFGIGYQAESLGKTELDYRSITTVSGTTQVLFELYAEGKRVFLLKDLDTGEEKTVVLPAGSTDTALCVDRGGKYLCGYRPGAEELGGTLCLYAFESGQKIKEYELAELSVNPSIALSDAADYVLVGLYDNGAGYEDHGGETVTAIKIGA